MTIETLFNLGDKVFVLHNDKIYEVEIVSLCAFTEIRDVKINYEVRFKSGGTAEFSERRLFATKQALIDTL